MATSLQCRHAAILVVAALAVLFIGSSEAWECPSGFKDCNPYKPGCDTCIKTDIYNCGDCGKKCKQVPYAITKCINGCCQEPKCKAGWGNCDGNLWSNGCETNLNKNIHHCGWCGHKCEVTLKGGEATCKHGHCGQQCKSGTKFDKLKNCCVPVY